MAHVSVGLSDFRVPDASVGFLSLRYQREVSSSMIIVGKSVERSLDSDDWLACAAAVAI